MQAILFAFVESERQEPFWRGMPAGCLSLNTADEPASSPLPTGLLEHLPANRRLFFLTVAWGAFSEDVLEVMGSFAQAFDETEESPGLGGIVCVPA